VYLEPSVSSPYHLSVFGLHVCLYIGEVDPRSPATLSIRVGDLTKEMQEFWGFIGYPRDEDDSEPAFRSE
jgi:hypothetical protein